MGLSTSGLFPEQQQEQPAGGDHAGRDIGPGVARIKEVEGREHQGGGQEDGSQDGQELGAQLLFGGGTGEKFVDAQADIDRAGKEQAIRSGSQRAAGAWAGTAARMKTASKKRHAFKAGRRSRATIVPGNARFAMGIVYVDSGESATAIPGAGLWKCEYVFRPPDRPQMTFGTELCGNLR